MAEHKDKWMNELRALFPVPEEFEIADRVAFFAVAHSLGLTPQQAYDQFDAQVACQEVAA